MGASHPCTYVYLVGKLHYYVILCLDSLLVQVDFISETYQYLTLRPGEGRREGRRGEKVGGGKEGRRRERGEEGKETKED